MDIVYRPGIQNGNADGLSRQSWIPDTRPSLQDVPPGPGVQAKPGGDVEPGPGAEIEAGGLRKRDGKRQEDGEKEGRSQRLGEEEH